MTRSEIIVAKTSLILATILILCFSSFAEESLITAYADGAYIHGTVKKSDGKPLQYAEVMVKGTSEGTTTDKAGRFTLKIPESAESILTASYTGYMPKSIIVAPGDDNVNIVLAEDFTRLGEIVVTATRTPKTLSESPVITRIITENDIVRQNPANVSELLQSELPGIEFRFAMNQQTSIDMQGFGGTSVLFLIDGERMSGETLDNVDYSRINTDNIQRIEIVKGAGSSLYGSNAIGAVVNIITKENKLPWSLSLSSQYGGRKDYENKMAPNLRNNMTWGLNLGKWNNLLTFQHADNAGCSLPAGDFTKIYGNYSLQLNDQLKYKISKRISLIGRYSCFFRQRDYQETDKDRYRDFNGGVKMTWQPDESNNLEAGWSIDQYDKSDYYTRNKKDICDYSNIQNSIRVFYTHTLSHGNSISAGGDYMNDYLMSYQFKDDSSHSQNIIDLFAQYDWNISDRLNLVTSLRSDYYSLSGFNISPRISIKFKAADKLSLRGSYAQGFRAPTLKEMYMDFDMAGIFNIYGSPDLKSEHNKNISLSAEYSGRYFNFNVSGYLNGIDNRIAAIWDSGLNGQKYCNTSHVDIIGADATASIRYPCGIAAKISYSFTHESTRGGEMSISDFRPHSAIFNISYGKQYMKYSFDVALSGRFMSAEDSWTLTSSSGYKEYEQRHYPAYMIWKLVASQRLPEPLKLTLSIDNLLNYRPQTYFFNSPITLGTTFSIGLSIDIEKIYYLISDAK